MYLNEDFPHLNPANHQPTSEPTTDYNSIAWAMNEKDRWWSPDPFGIYYWPQDVPRTETLDAYTHLFELYGYVLCSNADLESGYEKVAIYANSDGEPTHVARQLPCGRWTSKLGQDQDIRHNSLACLNDGVYGLVFRFLKREIFR